jgi:hypothetical protein
MLDELGLDTPGKLRAFVTKRSLPILGLSLLETVRARDAMMTTRFSCVGSFSRAAPRTAPPCAPQPHQLHPCEGQAHFSSHRSL